MARINILSPHIADLIAAGEVVERPASAVKELIENALDALAKNITLELRGGGGSYIRVTDDGSGMSPEDAGLCFLRHATSKLANERGLEAIGTMGFRGEALAAIASVSRIELQTRERGADTGTRVLLEAGDILEMGPAGCPEGTSITVRDLFFNTPARLKFMKSDRAEGSASVSAALRCALGRPEVSVRCIKDDKEEFFSSGDGRADSCVYSLLGRELAQTLLPCASSDGGIEVSGFVSSPSAGRGNRAQQYFFCNGRSIRSPSLQAAVEQAYRNTLLIGRFPACVLYIKLSPGSVDVNVHPAKAEVKFSDEKRVFDSVYCAALAALESENRSAVSAIRLSAPKPLGSAARERAAAGGASPASGPGAAPPRSAHGSGGISAHGSPLSRGDFFRSMDIKEFMETFSDIGQKDAAPVQTGRPGFEKLAEPNSPFRSGIAAPGEAVHAPAGRPAGAGSAQAGKDAAPHAAPRLIGEAMGTYILAQSGDELVFIDKHAAHERMIFDRLKAQDGGVMSQQLLTPQVFSADEAGVSLLLKNAGLLSRFGFELEPFGEDRAIVRALPADTDPGDGIAMLEEILDAFSKGSSLSPESLRDSALRTVACKAAIKAGKRSEPRELEELLREVVEGRVKYCPHGRPVSFALSKTELDKRFKRIV